MTVPRDPTSRDPPDPFGSGPVGGPAASAPTTAGEAVTPTAAAASPITDGSPRPTPTAPSTPAGTGSGRGGAKVKAAALVAGAATLLNKLRKEAPRKARQVREKRVAGRCVLLTEVAGRPVVIGPYRDEQVARQVARHDLTRVTGAPQVLELKSQAAYFGTPDNDPSVTS